MKKKVALILALTFLFQGMPVFMQKNDINASDSSEIALPSRYDARELGLVSPVKNQGRSNACWAHAAMSSVETAFKKAGYNTDDFYDFSEGHLAVNSSPLTDLQSGSTGYDAINYFSRLDGPVKDGRYPEDSEFYEFSIARSGNGTLFNGIPLLRDVNQKKHMKFVGDMIVISNKTDEIKRYIMEYGSVMSSYYQETHRLFGPVMTETADNRSRVENAYHATSKRRANHAVILVGWDDNIEIKESLFSKKTVRGAYLVKNSWGTQLKGMDGYYWMSYSSFGSDKNYVFTNVSEKKENAHVYLYDTYGTSSLSGVMVDEPENIFLNIFERKTENPERITDIPLSIYQVENQEVDYDIFIGQSNEEDRNWINQEENFTLVRTDKAINRNGFYTIKLLDEVMVSQKYFAVKLVLRRNGTKTPTIGSGKEVNDVKHHASYIFNSEKGKFDLESSYNLSLRAITEEVVPTVEEVTISQEAQKAPAGETIRFTATVRGENNPSTEVLWEVKNNTDDSTAISPQGVLYIGENEKAERLTIVAKSVTDESKAAEAWVEVFKIEPATPIGNEPEKDEDTEKQPETEKAEKDALPKEETENPAPQENTETQSPKEEEQETEESEKQKTSDEEADSKTQSPSEEPKEEMRNPEKEEKSEEEEREDGSSEEASVSQEKPKVEPESEREEEERSDNLAEEEKDIEEKDTIEEPEVTDKSVSPESETEIAEPIREDQPQPEADEPKKEEKFADKPADSSKAEEPKRTAEDPSKEESAEPVEEKQEKIEQTQAEANDVPALHAYSPVQELVLQVDRKAATPQRAENTSASKTESKGTGEASPIVREAERITEIYSDLAKDSPYLEAIHFVVSNQWMQGTGEKTFSADEKATRAAVVQVLYNFMKMPKFDGKHGFTDIAAGSWYEKSVVWAWQSGIVSGMDKHTFAPEQNITTEQLAVILHHFAQSQEKEEGKASLPKGETDLSWQDYWDEKAISPWAADAMKWLLEKKLLPEDKTKVNPKAEISRGELAVIMQKYVMGMEE